MKACLLVPACLSARQAGARQAGGAEGNYFYHPETSMKKIFSKLNKTFDNRVRLGIMSVLMVNDWVEFKTLKEMMGLTDGNLASNITALEKQKYLKIRKQFIGKKPQTTYAATALGRKAFNEHLDALEALLNQRKTDDS